MSFQRRIKTYLTSPTNIRKHHTYLSLSTKMASGQYVAAVRKFEPNTNIAVLPGEERNRAVSGNHPIFDIFRFAFSVA